MPSKSSNGPSLTLTCSPISKWISVRGLSSPSCTRPRIAVHLGVAHRHRAPLRTQEPGDAVDRVDQVIALVGHLHPHQHVAGHETTLGRDLLAAANLDHLFGRHQNLFDLVLKLLLLDRRPDLFGDLLLEVREHAHRIPPLRHLASTLVPAPHFHGVLSVRHPSGGAHSKIKSARNTNHCTPVSEGVVSTTRHSPRIQGAASAFSPDQATPCRSGSACPTVPSRKNSGRAGDPRGSRYRQSRRRSP